MIGISHCFERKHNSNHKTFTLPIVIMSMILLAALEVGDGRTFWNWIKLQQTEGIGVSPLQVGGTVFDPNKKKADFVNKHF